LETGRRKHSSQRAISPVISATIMAALVIAMGIATLAWAQGVSLNFIQSYSSAINADIDRLKERLTTEYINYASTPQPKVTIYLLNCGTIDDVAIQSITIRKNGWYQNFIKPSLKLLNGTAVPNLDQRQEGSVEISLGTSLTSGYYFVTIVTVRGAVFNAGFVA